MGSFVLRRLTYMVLTVFGISIVAFLIIQLPPGDYLTTLAANLEKSGQGADPAYLASLRVRYGLDQSVLEQYGKWIGNIMLHGDFGQSFKYGRPVSALLAERLPWTIVLGVSTLLLGWVIALPAGIYSAIKKYSVGDYVLTSFAFLGIAVPGFMVALAVSYLMFRFAGVSVGGLFSPEWVDARWNLGKVLDLLAHLWLPVLVLSLEGVGGTIRVLRANLLDELHRPYVVTARARGLSERAVLVRYPVRVALNPFISTAGWILPGLFGGEVIVAQVLGLPSTGPLLLGALQAQDMYLAGSIILIVSVLTVFGTLISDILLAVVDPRIRSGLM